MKPHLVLECYSTAPVPELVRHPTHRQTVGSLAPHGFCRVALAIGHLVVAFGLWANAQTNFTVDWYSVDGGGGTSTGGVYSIAGTMGQLDAGQMSGGDFTVEGGFWSIVAAIQSPGAPHLSVAWSNNVVVVSWPLPDAGWTLQSTTDLVPASGVWLDHPPPYQTNSTDLYYVEPMPTGKKFYRLKK